MPTPATGTRIPIAFLGLALIFRIGTFLLWPLIFMGILALCGLLVWAGIEAGRYLLILYALPIAAIGGYIYFQSATLMFRKQGSADLAVVASRSEYPALWAFAEQSADAVGSIPPDNIIVVMSANFYVTQSPVWLVGRSSVVNGRTLYVSAPLLRLMSEMEIKAVLAHEFAHFTGSDTMYSTQVVPVYASLSNGITAMKSGMGWSITGAVLALPLLVAIVYHRLFHIMNSAISRTRELRCDEIASQVYGETHIGTGLIKVVGYGSVLTQYIDAHFVSLIRENKIFHNYPAWFTGYTADESVRSAVNDLISNALATKTQASDSHPALKDRLKALNVETLHDSLKMTAHHSRNDAFGLKPAEVELTELYTQNIRHQLGDYTVPSRRGQSEALIYAGIDYISRCEYQEALEVFSEANELDSESVYAYITDRYGGGQDDHDRTISPYDIVRTIRQENILHGVREAILSKRAQQGFPRMMGNSVLGQSALRVSYDLAGVEIKDPGHVSAEFNRGIKQDEYSGRSSVAYYREVWDMDTPDEEIVSSMTNVLYRQFDDTLYEDFGMGITCGYPSDDHSRFGVFIVIGVGCTDGGAYAISRINEARASSGVAPLNMDYSLRAMTRKYIAMNAVPDQNLLDKDIQEAGYAEPGSVVRQSYGGAYSSTPVNMDELTYKDAGERAASALLEDYSETLLRSDWHDIGIAIRFVAHSDSRFLRRVQAEFVIAWQLPEGTERPDHFPPPLDKPNIELK